MGWLRNYKASKRRSEEAERVAVEGLERVEGQRDQVSRVSAFLQAREARNGFGEEFELTLVPRGLK